MSRGNIYNIYFTAASKKQFDSLSVKVRQEITKILEEEIARNPLMGKPLHGVLKGLRSERIGNLRLIYQIIKMELIVMVISIDHRGQVYRKRK